MHLRENHKIFSMFRREEMPTLLQRCVIHGLSNGVDSTYSSFCIMLVPLHMGTLIVAPLSGNGPARACFDDDALGGVLPVFLLE